MMFRVPTTVFAGLCALVLVAPPGAGRAQDKPEQPASAQSPDKRHAAFAEDRTIKIIDGRTQRPVRTMLGHTARVTALAFSPDGKLLASGGADASVALWHVATGRQVLRMRAGGVVTAVSFSPDGKMVRAREADKTEREWDVATGRLLKSSKGEKPS